MFLLSALTIVPVNGLLSCALPADWPEHGALVCGLESDQSCADLDQDGGWGLIDAREYVFGQSC